MLSTSGPYQGVTGRCTQNAVSEVFAGWAVVGAASWWIGGLVVKACIPDSSPATATLGSISSYRYVGAYVGLGSSPRGRSSS